jgi:predicted dehydrogenase
MSASRQDLRLALIGAGWISGYHLDAFDRLGRTRLVGVASGRLESAAAVAGRHAGVPAYGPEDLERMLDEQRPDVALVAVPPGSAIAALEPLVERGIAFLAEKPLAATDADGPARIAARVAAQGLVAAVGYHLRGLEALAEVRRLLAERPAHFVSGRWLCDTPPPAWWRAEATGGGQVVEQATHLYDLARLLAGEATVVAAVSTGDGAPAPADGVPLVDATASLLRFASGAVGTFANSRRLASNDIALELAADGLWIAIRKTAGPQTDWEVTIDDGVARRVIPPGRDPYEVQAAAFLDAVESGDPEQVLATYADALRTDHLTRSVVAAAGHRY